MTLDEISSFNKAKQFVKKITLLFCVNNYPSKISILISIISKYLKKNLNTKWVFGSFDNHIMLQQQ